MTSTHIDELCQALRDWSAYCELPVELFCLGIMLITGGHRRLSMAESGTIEGVRKHLSYLTQRVRMEEAFLVGAIVTWAEIILEQLSEDWPKFRRTASPLFQSFGQHPEEFVDALKKVSGLSLADYAQPQEITEAMAELQGLLDRPPTREQLRKLKDAHRAWQMVTEKMSRY